VSSVTKVSKTKQRSISNWKKNWFYYLYCVF